MVLSSLVFYGKSRSRELTTVTFINALTDVNDLLSVYCIKNLVYFLLSKLVGAKLIEHLKNKCCLLSLF